MATAPAAPQFTPGPLKLLGTQKHTELEGFTVIGDAQASTAYCAHKADALLYIQAPVMYYVLKRLLDELPRKRDWLDPDLERLSRDVLKDAVTG